MPTYLSHRNFATYSNYVPSVFNACTVFGSALLGYFYSERERIRQSEFEVLSLWQRCLVMLNKNMKSYSLFYSCLIIGCCLLIFFLIESGVAFYMTISGVAGFFLGGAFNMLAGNEVITITKGDRLKIGMLSTLSMTVGNLVVGTVEIFIGLALNVKKDRSQ